MRLGKVKGWVGAGLAEAAGRILILSGATAYLAHVLPPGEFGASALALSVATVFGVLVTAPYEETLAQRRVVRAADLRAALAALLAVACACTLISLPLGLALDAGYARDDMRLLVPVTCAMLFGQAPLVVLTALARRRRAFYAINLSNLIGHALGGTVAVALGLAGAGIWALIALRVAVVLGTLVALAAILRVWLWPAWSGARLRSMSGFAGFMLLTRLVENGTFFLYNGLVGALFGLTVLGYANIAMRLIEPLRGAIVAITHNLCFSFFMAARGHAATIGEDARRISAESSVVIAPTFMGVAAISPILMPLVGGPGWTMAVPIAAAFAAGGMLALPTQVVQSALSVAGQPRHILHANAVGLATTVLVLLASAGADPMAVGLARLAGDGAQTVVTLWFGGRLIALQRGALLRHLAGSWSAACLMAVAVAMLATHLASLAPAALALAGAMGAGVAIYLPLLFILDRPGALDVVRRLGLGLRPARTNEVVRA